MPHYQYCTVQKAKPRRSSTVLPRTATMNRGAANPLLGLQRSIGNRAVQRLIQSHPKDPRSLHLMGLQAKLAVGPPGNLYEQEADQVAGRVMAMPAPIPSKTLQPEGMNEEQEEPPVQSKALGASITPLGQRQTLENEAESPQMHAAITESCQADAGVGKTIKQKQDGGCCLPDSVRKYMEPRFGVDFSEVRIHQGSESAKLNKALSAQAFTVGHNIFLGAGKAVGNSRLLAHELTHVVQQTGGKPISFEKKPAGRRPCQTCDAKSRKQISGPTGSKKQSRQRTVPPSFSAMAPLVNQTVWRSPGPTSNNCWSLRAKCYYHCTKRHLWRYPPDTKGFQRCRSGCCDWAFNTCRKDGTWPCVFHGM